MARAVRIVFVDRGANLWLTFIHIRGRAVANVHLLAVFAKQNVACPVAAGQQVHKLFRLSLQLGLADLVLESDNGVSVADVKISLPADILNRHSERSVQARGEGESFG